MGRFTQKGRALAIATPLGEDALLLTRVSGAEALSEPFLFQLEMLAEIGTPIEFKKVLGQKATVTIGHEGVSRQIHGVIRDFAQGGRVPGIEGRAEFVRYRAELVPEFWLLTRRIQSRVFQDQSVWQVLETILKKEWGLSVSLRAPANGGPGTSAYVRNYCVQYQESDFAFVSRLMEEEGIHYYFPHLEGSEEMMIAESAAMPELPAPTQVPYRDSLHTSSTGPAVRDWEKRQMLPIPRHIVRDFNFEKPDQPIEAQTTRLVPDEISIGRRQHQLNFQKRVNDVDLFEAFDFPAGFAARVDGIDRGGADNRAKLQDLYREADRWATLRRDETAARVLQVRGSSDFPHFRPGFRFQLSEHFEKDANNTIGLLLTRVEHEGNIESAYVGGSDVGLPYKNRFECLPEGIAYRPVRRTPRPRIDGCQTAMVVGPAGQEIFVDLFGRVKVKFPWDRRTGAGGPDSSCWVRVAQLWAGKGWGSFFWPRIGHEVVVVFEGGDPERPLIVGSVYNSTNLPPVELPGEAQVGGIKSCIFGGDPTSKFNAIVFHDTSGVEYIQVHSEKSAMDNAEANRYQFTPGTNIQFNGPLPWE